MKNHIAQNLSKCVILVLLCGLCLLAGFAQEESKTHTSGAGNESGMDLDVIKEFYHTAHMPYFISAVPDLDSVRRYSESNFIPQEVDEDHVYSEHEVRGYPDVKLVVYYWRTNIFTVDYTYFVPLRDDMSEFMEQLKVGDVVSAEELQGRGISLVKDYPLYENDFSADFLIGDMIWHFEFKKDGEEFKVAEILNTMPGWRVPLSGAFRKLRGNNSAV
jgi:hypothetical protein